MKELRQTSGRGARQQTFALVERLVAIDIIAAPIGIWLPASGLDR